MPIKKSGGLCLFIGISLFIMITCRVAASSEAALPAAHTVGGLPYSLFCEALYYEYNFEYEKAREIYRDILERKPDAAYVYYKLAVLYRTYSELDTATSLLEKAIEHDPQLARAYRLLAQKYGYLNQPDEVVRLYLKAIENLDDALDFYLNLATIYYGQGKPEQAIETLQKPTRSYTESPSSVIKCF